MKHVLPWVVVILATPLWVGCGTSQPGSTGSESAEKTKIGPEYTVFRFLEAIRVGNTEQASAQLTPLATERMEQHGRPVGPPGSETASFRVGKVRRTPDGTAWVACQWTDLNAQGKPFTHEMTWRVVEIDGKWLVTGMSAQVVANRPPVMMNFEDPEDMIRQAEQFRTHEIGHSDGETLEARKSDPFRTSPK